MSLIGKSIGNYQIKAKLGEGGMGAVYLGEHPLIGKRVAVKVLLEELASKEDIVSRFFNEAKAVNDIGHQNIVDIVDFGKMKNDFGQRHRLLHHGVPRRRIARRAAPSHRPDVQRDDPRDGAVAARRWRRRTPRASSIAT